MERRTLVLFTASFPFGKKETYIETEIEYLAQGFESVHIYPFYFNDKRKTARVVPPNVVVNRPAVPKNSFSRFSALVIALLRFPSIWSWLEEFFSLKLYESSRLRKRWLIDLVNFTVVSNSHQRKSLDNFSNAAFYFYWGTDWAYHVPQLANDKSNRYSVRLHGGDSFLERNGGYIPLRDEIYAAADVLLPISWTLSGYIRERYNSDASFVISPLGTRDFGVSTTRVPEEIVLVSVSNIIPLKRIHLMIEVLAEITDLIIRWHHFGDGPERKKLEIMSQERLGANIQWTFEGSVANVDLMEFYKQNHVDCFINLSEHEGVPVSIMEALSFGIPVIATDAGATREVVNHDVGHLLTLNFSLAGVVQHIRALRNETWAVKRSLARAFWEENYSAEVNYRQLLQELISN